VKCGSGAFMQRRDDARRLAETMVGIGRSQGVETESVLTDMDSPLGMAVGNALEVIECLETLKGRGPARLEALSIELAARMVRLAGLASNVDEAKQKVTQALRSGQGLEKFRQIVEQQGGNPKAVDDYRLMPIAPKRMVAMAPKSGFITRLEAEPIGRAAMLLGAGRNRHEDAIDPSVGLIVRVHNGESVKAGQTMLELFGHDEAKLHAAALMAGAACQIEERPVENLPLIFEVNEAPSAGSTGN
jgi:thymidine phosphorylase